MRSCSWAGPGAEGHTCHLDTGVAGPWVLRGAKAQTGVGRLQTPGGQQEAVQVGRVCICVHICLGGALSLRCQRSPRHCLAPSTPLPSPGRCTKQALLVHEQWGHGGPVQYREVTCLRSHSQAGENQHSDQKGPSTVVLHAWPGRSVGSWPCHLLLPRHTCLIEGVG